MKIYCFVSPAIWPLHLFYPVKPQSSAGTFWHWQHINNNNHDIWEISFLFPPSKSFICVAQGRIAFLYYPCQKFVPKCLHNDDNGLLQPMSTDAFHVSESMQTLCLLHQQNCSHVLDTFSSNFYLDVKCLSANISAVSMCLPWGLRYCWSIGW